MISLLSYQNPMDAMYPDLAHQFQHNRAEFNEIARDWTRKYAM